MEGSGKEIYQNTERKEFVIPPLGQMGDGGGLSFSMSGNGYGENFTITYDQSIKSETYAQSIKSDKGKPQIALVPPQIIRDIAEVREYGLKKYGSSESWREVSVDRYINALLRHTLLFMEDPYGTDEESGIKHYKHMACNLAFLCELMKGE